MQPLPSCLFQCSAAWVIDMCFGSQMNRRMVCLALNVLFTGDPAKDPALAKVHQAVGLEGTKPILHYDHPVVVGTEELLQLCPPDTNTKSIVDHHSKPVNAQFTSMLGKFLFSIQIFLVI